MDNLTIIGTSHIARQSLQEIEQSVKENKPDLIALELDPNRFQALISNQKSKIRLRDITQVGVKGFLFAVIGAYIQKKLGKMVGVQRCCMLLNLLKKIK